MDDIADIILAEALTWQGTPYRHQGSRKGVGCDCLGFVRGVWTAVYGGPAEEPGPYAADWAEAGGGDRLLDAARRHCDEKPVSAMAPGDLLAFRWRAGMNAKHCGIFADEGRFLHAYQRHAVVLSPLGAAWRSRIAGVFGWPAIGAARPSPSLTVSGD